MSCILERMCNDLVPAAMQNFSFKALLTIILWASEQSLSIIIIIVYLTSKKAVYYNNKHSSSLHS